MPFKAIFRLPKNGDCLTIINVEVKNIDSVLSFC